MVEVFNFLASGVLISNLFDSLESSGIVSHVLPFLLIFALVLGLLEKMQIFKDNRAVNGIIALAIGLMALQFDMVSVFFSQIFPRFGIGLAVLLVVMILAGMFIPSKQTGILLIASVIIFVVVLVNTAGAVGWSSGTWWSENWADILVVVGVIALVSSLMYKPRNPDKGKSLWQALVEKEGK